ncbi:NAD(P)-dependent dehydrogenase (short-subunit alcohol dehydrogenase family) [Kibdelosporangium banguiense]|uniref:NAD(P)-dependent dehydrogenase (Short-subunit alcohol dehydrogenase family) n=1 Tax=Kibdelosporangium banguiense TaxID=1365924 RepID=A0ABS4TB59_9PSEU|nr:SDR family NAD(P)-dependent oxidoreductase [Kibdelosporangium banguiense]MBP2321628.1 NAD(P)-dependent dehydrogenase (short-subunit alcohol dehydrogenase family) [Kibdelosporangium banguiense]
MGRVVTPFSKDSTAEDVLAGVDLTGKRAVVTGGASGIGTETARVLAAAGAEVTVAIRNSDVEVPKGITAAHLDLADRSSIAKFAQGWDGPLDILVNNAGVMALPELHRTAEGWELQFATNHLGHFALALGLHDALKEAGNARIVSVSSSAHRRSPVHFEDIHFENRQYDGWLAYGQSKTANILFAVEAAKRWAADGITVNALHPGGIRTNLQRHVVFTPELRELFDTFEWKSTEQGAATSALVAASPLLDNISGRYFEDSNEAEAESYALDSEAAKRLWDLSEELVA